MISPHNGTFTTMLQDQEGLLPLDMPLMFADGTAVYEDFGRKYITHQQGFFIMGPSGVGKSHFVRAQTEGAKHWVDADQLWRKTRAMPIGEWWLHGKYIEGIEQQCDIITMQAKKLGFWMLGSSCNWLTPDAIVIPDWETHLAFVKKRELNYDGGATSDRAENLQNHRQSILEWTKQGVPKFDSVDDAVKHLEAEYAKNYTL